MYGAVRFYNKHLIHKPPFKNSTQFAKELSWRFGIMVVGGVAVIFFISFFALFVYYLSTLFLFYPMISREINGKIKPMYLHFSVTLMVVGILLALFAGNDVARARKGYYTGTKIYTKDSTYTSDSLHFYIGKTQNYYFFHNRGSTNLIIPEREVLKFDLKTPRIFNL